MNPDQHTRNLGNGEDVRVHGEAHEISLLALLRST